MSHHSSDDVAKVLLAQSVMEESLIDSGPVSSDTFTVEEDMCESSVTESDSLLNDESTSSAATPTLVEQVKVPKIFSSAPYEEENMCDSSLHDKAGTSRLQDNESMSIDPKPLDVKHLPVPKLFKKYEPYFKFVKFEDHVHVSIIMMRMKFHIY